MEETRQIGELKVISLAHARKRLYMCMLVGRWVETGICVAEKGEVKEVSKGHIFKGFMNLAKPFEMNSEDNEELFKVGNITPANKQTNEQKIHSLQLKE